MTLEAGVAECEAELISSDAVTFVCGRSIGHGGPHQCQGWRWTEGRLPPEAIRDGWTTKP